MSIYEILKEKVRTHDGLLDLIGDGTEVCSEDIQDSYRPIEVVYKERDGWPLCWCPQRNLTVLYIGLGWRGGIVTCNTVL